MTVIESAARVLERSGGNAASSEKRLIDSSRDFSRHYDLRSFSFRHRLCDHPLFALPQLERLGQRLLDRGDGERFVAIDGKLNNDTPLHERKSQERVASAISRLATSNSWIKLVQVNDADPEYDELFQTLVDEIEEQSGRQLNGNITWRAMTIFLASPHVVTPYHVDHESNCLFQVHGAKDVCVYDTGVPTQADLERFYRGDPGGARIPEVESSQRVVYRLEPGMAVHHPPLAPHWVKNVDNVSVSVSIAFALRSLDARARVYQFNSLMRTVGLKPGAPGRSASSDAIKAKSLSLFCTRKPKSYREFLYSGIDRVTSPLRLAKRVVKRGK